VFEVWWENVLLLLFPKFTAKSAGEIIFKISQHLTKVEAKIQWHLFSAHVVLLNQLIPL